MVNKRIAFQGELGAYSEEALLLLHPGAVSQPHREFRDVARAVLEGRADLGILPIENSLVGSIATNFDLIAESGLAIVGEVVSAVHHCLLGVPGAKRGAAPRGCAREDDAAAQAAAPAGNAGPRARRLRRGRAQSHEAREPSRPHDAVGVSLLPGRGGAGGGWRHGRGPARFGSAGRGGHGAGQLPALHAARLTIARHPKYTGTPSSTRPSPSAL